jgi:hypothetical protein
MADLISDNYKRLLQTKHEGKPWGGAGKSWVPTILPLLNHFEPGPITILDFGCGRGTFKPAIEPLHPDVVVTEYDPGVAGKDTLPMKPVDLVVCTDVMEHVEEKYVVDTLRTINWLAIHGVFFNIDTALSKSFLPDGRNTHITIKPAKWWREMLDMHIPDMTWTVHEETRSRLVISGWRKQHVE